MEVTLKFGSFEKSGAKFIGIINGEKIDEIKGDIFTEKYDLTGNSYDISELKILPPVIPSSMLALAKNYGSHLQGEAPPKQPEPFFKTTSSIAGHNDEIIIPRDSKKVDAESELVVVIKQVFSIKVAGFLLHIIKGLIQNGILCQVLIMVMSGLMV